MKTLRSKHFPKSVLAAAIIVTGISMLVLSRAATTTLSVEAEQGQLASGAANRDLSDASGGNAIRFAAPTTPPPTGSWWKPAANTRWQWVLEGDITTSAAELNRFEMYDIDLTDAIPTQTTQTVTWANGDTRTVTWPKGNNAAAFTALKAAGKKVICYMDIGAFETHEPDAELFPGKWSNNNSRNGIAYNGPAAYANIDVIGGDSEDSAGGIFEGEF